MNIYLKNEKNTKIGDEAYIKNFAKIVESTRRGK